MTYEFYCNDCGHVHERFFCKAEQTQDKCPVCGMTSNRMVSPGNFILKGTGFYKNDYKK